jgi:membrane protease YdiL (CAAX protease family)
MNSANLSSPTKTAPDTKLGTLLRVLFFCAAVYVASSAIGTLAQWILDAPILVATLGTFAAGLLANLLTMRIFDRRTLADIGLGNQPGWSNNLLLGIGLGASAAVVLLVLPLLAHGAHFQGRSDSPHANWLGWILSLMTYLACLLFGAAGEESIFHGYAFQLLVQKLGPFATVLPVGLLFGLAHGANPAASKLGLLNTSLWGVLLGYAFLRSRDLWLPIGMHYGWNAILPLFGANLSGYTIEITRYAYRWDLPPVWSGGAYGPEGGLLTTFAIALLFVALTRSPVTPQVAAIATVLND